MLLSAVSDRDHGSTACGPGAAGLCNGCVCDLTLLAKLFDGLSSTRRHGGVLLMHLDHSKAAAGRQGKLRAVRSMCSQWLLQFVAGILARIGARLPILTPFDLAR